jgi:hypothetical protein
MMSSASVNLPIGHIPIYSLSHPIPLASAHIVCLGVEDRDPYARKWIDRDVWMPNLPPSEAPMRNAQGGLITWLSTPKA